MYSTVQLLGFSVKYKDCNGNGTSPARKGNLQIVKPKKNATGHWDSQILAKSCVSRKDAIPDSRHIKQK
jgi:hypothetical protein